MNPPTNVNAKAVPRWSESMIADWEKTRPIVLSVLAKAEREQDSDDVMQQAWLAAAEALERFDPARGAFSAWINSIAWRQAHAHLRRESAQVMREAAAKDDLRTGGTGMHEVISEDIATMVTSRVGDCSRLSEVLTMLRQAVARPGLFDRSMYLLVACDGDVKKASARLGVAPAALRDSHRNVLDLAHVIDRALQRHWQLREAQEFTGRVTVREMLRCLPDESRDDRAWLVTITRAVVASGGFGKVTPEQVAHLTGWSPTYARHCLARTANLLSVARTVLGSGRLI